MAENSLLTRINNHLNKLNCNYNTVQSQIITNLLNNIVSTYVKNKETVKVVLQYKFKFDFIGLHKTASIKAGPYM